MPRFPHRPSYEEHCPAYLRFLKSLNPSTSITYSKPTLIKSVASCTVLAALTTNLSFAKGNKQIIMRNLNKLNYYLSRKPPTTEKPMLHLFENTDNNESFYQLLHRNTTLDSRIEHQNSKPSTPVFMTTDLEILKNHSYRKFRSL